MTKIDDNPRLRLRLMTIRQALVKYRKLEVELLLAHVLKKSKEFLFMHANFILTSKHLNILSKLIKRRLKGEPVAYILGHKDFMGYRFKVNRDVLIPRPETEELVHKVLSSFAKASADRQVCKVYKVGQKIKILDVGTGSGCIAVSLAKQLQKAKTEYQIVASDVSKKALKVAKANARAHRVKIQFIHSDILQNIRMSFDVIIANLPYVSAGDYRKLIKGLEYEPKLALTDGTNRLAIYERFFKAVPAHLNPGGMVLLEIGPKSKSVLSKLAKLYLPSSRVKFCKDFNNLWRYLEVIPILKI